MKINFQMTAIALLRVVFFFWTEGAINLIWLCHGTDRHRVLRLLLMVFNILLPLGNSVDGWSLLGEGFLFGFLATISGYVCLNYSTSTIMMCKGSMIMIGGLWSKCHPKRTMDRQTDGCGSLASSFVPFWVHYHVYRRNVFLEDIPHYSDSSYPTVPRVPIHAGGWIFYRGMWMRGQLAVHACVFWG